MKTNLFGHHNISNEAVAIFIPIIYKDLKDKEATLKQLQLIDDCLGLSKMELLLTDVQLTPSGRIKKKDRRRLDSYIDDRISQDLNIKSETTLK